MGRADLYGNKVRRKNKVRISLNNVTRSMPKGKGIGLTILLNNYSFTSSSSA